MWFLQTTDTVLGHIISEIGIFVHPKNIRAIEEWPTLTSVIDIRPFLGLVGYYRKFIENVLRISCPMLTLEKKENKFLWKRKCKESF